jgi:hypothetical protein
MRCSVLCLYGRHRGDKGQIFLDFVVAFAYFCIVTIQVDFTIYKCIMKSTVKHIEKIRVTLAEQAKAKKENIEFFKKGGTLEDFKPKYKHVARPF